MSLSYTKGDPICMIKSKNKKINKKFIRVSTETDGVDEITLDPEDTLQILPSVNIVERIYLAAPSGAGKSYFISKWLGMNRKIFRNKNKKDIYIFSRINEDSQLDKFNPVRIDLDEMLEDPLTGEDLEDSICIFDDIDSIYEKDIKNAVYGIQKDLLTTGRHFNITVLTTSHLLTNSNETKYNLNESNTVVVYPRSGQTYQIKRFLKEYCGFETKMINKIMKLNSRWVAIRKTYPITIMHEHGCFMGCMDIA